MRRFRNDLLTVVPPARREPMSAWSPLDLVPYTAPVIPPPTYTITAELRRSADRRRAEILRASEHLTHVRMGRRR